MNSRTRWIEWRQTSKCRTTQNWAYYDPVLGDLYLEPDPDPAPPVDPRPEHVDYRDEGCELAPECLACPLPRCRHDDPGWLPARGQGEEEQGPSGRQTRRAVGGGGSRCSVWPEPQHGPPHPQGPPLLNALSTNRHSCGGRPKVRRGVNPGVGVVVLPPLPRWERAGVMVKR